MKQTINISVPEEMMKDIQSMVKLGHFASISEAFRAGINEVKTKLLPKYQTMQLSPEVEERMRKAMDQYDEGKAIAINSFSDLLE